MGIETSVSCIYREQSDRVNEIWLPTRMLAGFPKYVLVRLTKDGRL